MVSHGPKRKSPIGVMPERGIGTTMGVPDFPLTSPGICGARFLRQQEAGVSRFRARRAPFKVWGQECRNEGAWAPR